VKSGKSWLKDWVANGGFDDPGSSSNEGTEERSKFANAFDILSVQTPIALRLLTAYKCDHSSCSFSTAEGVWSAFKQYFKR